MKNYNWIKLLSVFLRCLGKLSFKHLLYMAKLLRYEIPHEHDDKVYINTFFPPYPSIAFDRFLQTVFDRNRIPFSTYFAVTDKCPYKCPHCSYGNHAAGDLNTEKAIEVVNQIKELGTITIGFTGGEPLLRKDLPTLIKMVSDKCSTVVFTTGHGLTEQLATDLYKSGLGCIMIGLESFNEIEHDKVRGVQGSFKQAIEAIKVSQEAGLYTAISTVATRDKINNGTIEKLAGLALYLQLHEFRILEPVPTGTFKDCTGELLTIEESLKLTEFHKNWNKKGKLPAIASFSHLESDKVYGCGAGYHHLFIDAVGNVCPCDLTPLSFGNVFDKPLLEIWNEMSQWFSVPRCGCLMKDIQTHIKDHELFPIEKDKSIEICQKYKQNTPLPKVFENLFKDHKPINPT